METSPCQSHQLPTPLGSLSFHFGKPLHSSPCLLGGSTSAETCPSFRQQAIASQALCSHAANYPTSYATRGVVSFKFLSLSNDTGLHKGGLCLPGARHVSQTKTHCGEYPFPQLRGLWGSTPFACRAATAPALLFSSACPSTSHPFSRLSSP